ncbi:aldehyde dehydrogenase family protein [Paeniglutamicibacter psychrophenolicus]|uniref:Succinate-semialdehyde dehydrogenase/glutarate-semialdehyde dehydrogenase n=1 Tax=Paeniglutamicibacter psychrophenolicus TaxID=257454 RepID=A0ABS4WEP2_9MICC|nr:NAD-dependent succinate-semialdehyde dehydrogenase [Paeniglutamicibacter psychrophenolicus]MBP2374685.1 succinate-semialdehyde dehydrogenase/glutarate-semialdehyde dehydrogenase [Paeniglutamicibacter psychrophenolicus]
MSVYAVTNPATGIVEATYPSATDPDIQAALARAHDAFGTWNTSAIATRAALLDRVADLYEERRDELAAIITREMGKPIFQSGKEIDITVSIYRYYAANGEKFLQDEQLEVASGGTAVIRKEGVGVLLGIMPWNFPYYQVARFAAPNLMNGNTILLKHAPQCPESALAMERIFADAGAPAGAYVNVFATNDQVADVIADPRIQGVSLTGSERAGSAVAAIAGANLKKVVLELGGSDPFLVLEDANVKRAAKQAMAGRFGNTGQACNAAKRIIVDASVYDEFVEDFTGAVAGIKVGDPAHPETFLGPLSSAAARDSLAAQVQDAIDKGATVLAGGAPLQGDGSFFAPTVLADVTEEMRAYTEELFGPVAVLYKVSGDAQAVALANSSAYGLGASIQTQDMDRAHSIARQLEVGMVSINQTSGSAAELPFGGVKRSGVGRELGKYGMEEFVNRKLVTFRG